MGSWRRATRADQVSSWITMLRVIWCRWKSLMRHAGSCHQVRLSIKWCLLACDFLAHLMQADSPCCSPFAKFQSDGIIAPNIEQSVDRDEYCPVKVPERGGHWLQASSTGQAGKPPGSGSLKSRHERARKYGTPGWPVIAAERYSNSFIS